jgi:alpha-1,2-mannosyltransferase
MTGIVIYILHLTVFVAGVLALRATVRGNRPAIEIIVVGAIVSSIAGWLTFRFTIVLPPLSDFIRAYCPAGKAVMQDPRALAPLLKQGVNGFVNLPILAWLFAPFAALEPKTAGLFFTCLGIAAGAASWWLLVGAAHLDRNGAVLLFFMFSANGPLHYSMMEGNLSHVLLLPIAGAFLLLRKGRDHFAGVLLAVAAIIKPPLLLFGLYFLLRARWRVVLGGTSVVAAVAAASLVLFGWDMHVLWFNHCILPFSMYTIPAYNVQTLHAFLGRLEYGASYLHSWESRALPVPFRIAATLGVCSFYAAAIVSALPRNPTRISGVRRLSGQTLAEIEFFIVLALAIVASPLSWSHYYVWLLIPTAFWVGHTDHFPDNALTRWIAWAAILLVTLPIFHMRISNVALADLFARSLVSYLFAGGVLMLAVLVRSRWKAAPLVT